MSDCELAVCVCLDPDNDSMCAVGVILQATNYLKHMFYGNLR